MTVFVCDISRYRDKLPLARNALKRAKTIRFPGALKFIDGIEVWRLSDRMRVFHRCACPLPGTRCASEALIRH